MNNLNEQDLIKENQSIVELTLTKIRSMKDGERVVFNKLANDISDETGLNVDYIEGIVYHVLHRLDGLVNSVGRNGGTFKSFKPKSVKYVNKQLSKELQEAVDNAKARAAQIISE